MGEAKRIIRYILPGMVYIILLLLPFVITKPNTAKAIFFNPNSINAGIALGGFIISGGLGYIFSIIYFGIFWLWSICSPSKHLYNHFNVIKDLIEQRKLKIAMSSNGKDYEIKDRKEAWYIVNVYWHSRTNSSPAIKGISEKLDAYYSDLTTALATTLIASICSLITFVFLIGYYYKCWSCWEIGLSLSIYSLFIFFCALNFIGTYRAYEVMINIAFASEVEEEYKKNGYKPIDIFYPK